MGRRSVLGNILGELWKVQLCTHTHTHVYIRTCFDLVSFSLSLSLFPPSLSLFTVENEAHCDFTKLREMLLR